MDERTKEVWMAALVVADKAIEAHNSKVNMIGGSVTIGIALIVIGLLVYTW